MQNVLSKRHSNAECSVEERILKHEIILMQNLPKIRRPGRFLGSE